MVKIILITSLILFGIAISITLVRVIIGPTLPDRILSLDIIGVQLVSTLAIISVLLDTPAFLEAILVLAILAFISTISFTKYMERGAIIDRKRDD